MEVVLFFVFISLPIITIAATALVVPRRWLPVPLLLGAAAAAVLPGRVFVAACYAGGVACILGARFAIRDLRDGSGQGQAVRRYLLASLLAFPASWTPVALAPVIDDLFGSNLAIRGEGEMILIFIPPVVLALYAFVFVLLVAIKQSDKVRLLLDESDSFVARPIASRWWVLALTGLGVFAVVGAAGRAVLTRTFEALFGVTGFGVVLAFLGSLVVLQVAMASVLYGWLKYALAPSERRLRVAYWMGVAGPMFAAATVTIVSSLAQGDDGGNTVMILNAYATVTALVSAGLAYLIKQNPNEFSPVSPEPTTGPP